MNKKYVFPALLLLTLVMLSCSSSSHSPQPDGQNNDPLIGEMILIPAGDFRMGSPPDMFQADEHPIHEVYLDAYYINAFEVTNAEYASFLSADTAGVDHWHVEMEITRSQNTFTATPGLEDYPVRYVTHADAQAYSVWLGGRLPTEAEWEKAARGPLNERFYPWGDHISIGQANWQNTQGLWEVGTATGTSYYGLYDMSGNVWEWVADWYQATYYYTSPDRNPTGPIIGDNKVIRGGSYLTENEYQLRCAARLSVVPENSYPDLGFRCVIDSANYRP